ncbi:MAG: hypothetical protein ACJA01_004311 [Saprospiraceae bacterium]|jgi:hypothetical protein
MEIKNLDCPACMGEQSMHKRAIGKFHGIIAGIGVIIVIIAIIDIFFSIMNALTPGLNIGVGFIPTIILLAIGIFFQWSIKVWKCSHCGYYVNRHGK